MNKMNNIKTTLTLLFLVWVTVCLSQCTTPQNNCNNFDIPVTNNTSAINYGIPEYNGQVLTDFLINWVDEDGNVVFTSAGGSFYDPNIHESHPPITDIPLGSGFYEPVLVDSNIDGITSCKSSVEIVPYECTGVSQTVTYEGVPDVTRYFEIIWANPDCELSIDFEDFTLVDNYVIYGVDGAGNQTVIYESTVSGEDNIITPDGTYETLLVEVTSSAGENTKWVFNFTCCYVVELCDCDDVTYDTEVSVTNNCEGSCELRVKTGNIIAGQGCDLRNINSNPLITTGACEDTQTPTTPCVNFSQPPTVDILAPQVVFNFNNISDLNSFSTAISGLLVSNNNVQINLNTFLCGNDQNIKVIVINDQTGVVYDDVNLTLEFTIQPFELCECYYNWIENFEFMAGVDDGTYSYFSYTLRGFNTFIDNSNITAVQYTVSPVNDGECVSGTSIPLTHLELRVIQACPCSAWQLYEDTTGDGTYDTLVDEAPNWTGTCQ